MKNELFDKKIRNEVLVDCNDDYDRNMSWFYYLEEQLRFPFTAFVPVKTIEKTAGEVFKRVNVIGLIEMDFGDKFEMKVETEFDRYIMEFPLAVMRDIRASDSVLEAIELWQYWVKR